MNQRNSKRPSAGVEEDESSNQTAAAINRRGNELYRVLSRMNLDEEDGLPGNVRISAPMAMNTELTLSKRLREQKAIVAIMSKHDVAIHIPRSASGLRLCISYDGNYIGGRLVNSPETEEIKACGGVLPPEPQNHTVIIYEVLLRLYEDPERKGKILITGGLTNIPGLGRQVGIISQKFERTVDSQFYMTLRDIQKEIDLRGGLPYPAIITGSHVSPQFKIGVKTYDNVVEGLNLSVRMSFYHRPISVTHIQPEFPDEVLNQGLCVVSIPQPEELLDHLLEYILTLRGLAEGIPLKIKGEKGKDTPSKRKQNSPNPKDPRYFPKKKKALKK